MKALLSCILLLLATIAIAQSDSPTTTAYREALIYAGPGHTHPQTGILNPGVEIQLVERNHTGNWVRVNRISNDGEIVLDGWVISGYLNLPEDLLYSEIPINSDLPDAVPENVRSQSMSQLYELPIIPEISDAMLQIYENGNQSNIVTKIGDSLSASEIYLTPFSYDEYDLGPYDYLEETLLHYGPSLAVESAASRIGLSTYVVFDPMWADQDLCESGESPLACEYRRKQPSIAFILFGPNDVRSMTDEEYAEQMRLIVEESLDAGVIPVLSTFSAHPDEEFWWQSINFNLRLGEIAAEYEAPLINLWSAARILPDYGLDEDLVHLTHSGFEELTYSTGHEAWYGVSLQNLLALRTLHEIHRTINERDDS